MIITAYILAVNKRVSLSRSHLKMIIHLDEKFQKDYNDVD